MDAKTQEALRERYGDASRSLWRMIWKDLRDTAKHIPEAFREVTGRG
jgi:hypothetical protein